MITVLQRQTVSKRTVPPVADRARSNGVRWTRPRDQRSAAPGHSFLRRHHILPVAAVKRRARNLSVLAHDKVTAPAR